MALDRVPGGDELYIGGIFSLHRKEALKQAKITHVLSVMRLPLGQDIFAPYKHMVVEVDDVEDENLLQHFNSANTFIHGGLSGGGGVLVHCAMGKSRSATCVIAYTMQKYRTTPQEALFRLRQAREICEPNDGFMEQLNLYHKMRCPNDVEEQTLYRRWLYKRHLDVSLACGQAPDVVRFEDEHAEDLAVSEAGEADLELRCRKCRRTLATSHYLAHHPSMTEDEDEDEDKDKDKDKDKDDAEARFPEHGDTTSVCAHYFLQPLSWMRPELEQGKLDGRLECPKCNTNVGKYAWQGMKCSCGAWIVPAISLAKGRIDEARPSSARGEQGGVGIRLPPGDAPGRIPGRAIL